ELVDDDEPTPAADGTAPPAGRRRSRRRLVVGAVVLAVLVAGAAVGQGVVERRDRARLAAVAQHPGTVALLDGPPRARWHMTETTLNRMVDLRTSDALLVGVQHVAQGPVA